MRADHAKLFERIEEKLDQHGLSAREASILATGKPDLIRDLKRAKGMPGGDRLSSLAEVLGTTVEWLIHGPSDLAERADLARSTVRTEVAATGITDIRSAYHGEQPLPALPLVGSAIGGEYEDIDEHVEMVELHLGEVLDYLQRPESLARDPKAYALRILSDSMSPRFDPGDQVAVSPRDPVAIGDYVILQLRDRGETDDRIKMVLIKRLVRRTAAYVELEQFNPPITFRVENRRVAHMHKVKGTLF
jgi:phage repressor protein C with HTH and peptisase S24 domain